MSVHHQTTLLVATGAIGKSVRSSVGKLDTYTLTVVDADGIPVGIGQAKSIEHKRGFQLTVHIERAIAALPRECVGYLIGLIAALNNAHIGTFCHDIEVLHHIASNRHRGSVAVIDDANGIIYHHSGIDIHIIYLAYFKGLAHDGECGSIIIKHITSLCCRYLICHFAHNHIKCLANDSMHTAQGRKN